MPRASHPVHLVLGPTIWALWFVVIYAALSVVCHVAPPAVDKGAGTWLNGALLALTLVVTALLLGAGVQCWRASRKGDPDAHFFTRVSAGAYLLSAASVLLIGATVIGLPPCL